MPARLGQPPGALLGQQHAQPQDGAGDELQADGDLPLRGRVVGDVLGDGVVDPVRGHDAEGEEELEHAAQHAADVLGRHLGGVHGHDDGGHADADARDDARDVKGRERVRVDGLDDGADVEDGGRQDEGPPAAVLGSKRPDEKAGEEGCFVSAFRTDDSNDFPKDVAMVTF